MKTCRGCKIEKPLELFFRDKRASDGRNSRCKPCQDTYTAKWRADNHEHHVERQRKYQAEHVEEYRLYRKRYYARHPYNSWLKSRYGITTADYERILSSQGGGCAICGGTVLTSRTHRFAVDHDHETGAIRGLLCNSCNWLVGNAHDDAAVLRRAADYLDRCSAVNASAPSA